MDEQTFRRLAADAVAGRLDDATYRDWKAAAAQDPARAAFVVRVAEADSRLSAMRPAVMAAPTQPRAPKGRALGMAVLVAAVGLLSGALVMNSYLRSKDAIPAPPASEDTAIAKPEPPAANIEPSADTILTPPVKEPESQLEPEADRHPEAEPQPQRVPEGLAVVALEGEAAVRGAADETWRKLALHEEILEGATVGSLRAGQACFRSGAVEMRTQGAFQFELVGGAIRFIRGRFSVRVSAEQSFSCYKESWALNQGFFIVEPKTLGGQLWLVEGDAQFQGEQGMQVVKQRTGLALDGTRNTMPLEPSQIRALELELLQPHERLLWWDGETPETTPEFCELVAPGALGDGRAMAHRPGHAGIGVSPSTRVFKAAEGARLRMRVKTSAPRLRVELRMQSDDGYRIVDAFVDVTDAQDWRVLEVPLDSLRAGRFRDEPGWLPGCDYSALLIAPAVDPDRPLTRHELAIDDVLVHVPR